MKKPIISQHAATKRKVRHSIAYTPLWLIGNIRFHCNEMHIWLAKFVLKGLNTKWGGL